MSEIFCISKCSVHLTLFLLAIDLCLYIKFMFKANKSKYIINLLILLKNRLTRFHLHLLQHGFYLSIAFIVKNFFVEITVDLMK